MVPRPKDKSVVSSKWIFKTKHSAYGSIEKFKERFVAQGFSQIRRNLLSRDHCTNINIYFYHNYHFIGNQDGMEDTSNGCKNNLPKWCHRRKSIF